MKSKENNSIINITDKELNSNVVNNTLSDNLSQKELKTNERKISVKPRSIIKFYRDNKSIITLSEKNFKQWLSTHYLAVICNEKFIATENAIENGYMTNRTKAIIDLEELNCFISYQAQITAKGQNYILDCFEEKRNARKN